MLDRTMLYDTIYALAACNGREAELFGSCAPLARQAFARSLAGSGFPELWFELPLAGEPWFDLHALASHDQLDAGTTFASETCGGCPEAFAWFAHRGPEARQLALSWDVSAGDLEQPAVQLLVNTWDPEVTCDFLVSAGRPDATGAYLTFSGRLPRDWYACYAGVFPRRTVPFLRVECIPTTELQQAYATDPALLREHMQQAGLDQLGDTLVPWCQHLAGTPFQLEFQFDVDPQGSARGTVGASVRFAAPVGGSRSKPFRPDAEGGELMRQAMAWGLVDERWHLLADTAFAKRLTYGSESALLYCFPAFLKLRWRDGEPLDAKAYLIAGIQ